MFTISRRLFVVLSMVVILAMLFPATAVQPAQAEEISAPNLADGWARIEAESYSSSTGSLRVCSGVLCYIGANASVQYNSVDLHSGTNRIDLSVANGGGNTGIQVWVGGVNLGTLTVSSTGGWNTYQTKSLTLPAQSGVKDVRLVFVNGNVNVDWFIFAGTGVTYTPTATLVTNTPTATQPTNTFTPTATQGTGRDGWARIEAESYNSSSGSLQVCSGVLCYVGANAWVQYNGVDLHNGTNRIDLSVANGGGNTSIQVWVGGVNLGPLTVGGTGSWNTYQTKSLTLPSQSGVKDVRLVFVNGNVNVDWLVFAATGTATSTPTGPTATSTPTSQPGLVAVPDGYAQGTTGGGNAAPITVSSASAFRSAVNNNNPAVIIVNGSLNLGGNVSIGSNKTIVGANASSGLYGGTIQVRGTNYIFQNLTIGPSTGDVMEISGGTRVFITKSTFHDSSDELLSVVRQADYVTISWSKFYFDSPTSHSFGHLIGNGDDVVADRGKLHVTLHHNWYAQGLRGRIPRVRFGHVHIYNNYYNSVGTGYVIGVGVESHIRVENSYFDNVNNPWADYGGASNGEFGWSNLQFVNSSQPTFMPNRYPVFSLPYSFTLDPVADVKNIVRAGAGNVFP